MFIDKCSQLFGEQLETIDFTGFKRCCMAYICGYLIYLPITLGRHGFEVRAIEFRCTTALIIHTYFPLKQVLFLP